MSEPPPPPDPNPYYNNMVAQVNSVLVDIQTSITLQQQIQAIIGQAQKESDLTPAQLSMVTPLINQFESLVGDEPASLYFLSQLNGLTYSSRFAPSGLSVGQQLYNGGLYYYSLENLNNGYIQRGVSASDGSLPSVFLAPSTPYSLTRFFPSSLGVTQTFFGSSPSGTATQIPDGGFLVQGATPDSVLGFKPTTAELAQLQQGINPFAAAPFLTGIASTLPLQGQAQKIVVVGSTLNQQQQLAYIATGTYGLAIVDTSRFATPTIMAELQLPGNSTDVSVDTHLQLAAVASTTQLNLVNVANPQSPKLYGSILINTTQVQVVDGVAYAAVGADIQSYDLVTGEQIQDLALGGSAITGMAREGYTLYTMDHADMLHAIDISGPAMVAEGSLAMPAGGGSLFVGNGVAYVGNEQGTSHQFGGFATANVSNPNSLKLLSAVGTTGIGGEAIAANGSGLAITVGRPGSGQFGSIVDLMNVSDPTDTKNLVTQFSLPDTGPTGVTLAAGIAFIADGSSGLQVINYLPFDTKGKPPIASLTTGVLGPNVVEGSTLSLKANVSDDVQVRNVGLLVNGMLEENLVSFPYNLSVNVPLLSSGVTTLTLQLEAFDTGGNIGLSKTLTYTIVKDTIPPTVTG